MSTIAYTTGAVTMLICALLLLRGYGRTKQKLLLWSSVCFFGLALSNAIIFLDLIVLPQIDLYRVRLATAAIAMLVLLYGLIWESER